MKKGNAATSKKLKEKLEDLDDVRLYDEAKRIGGRYVPLSEYIGKRKTKK